MCPVSQGVSSQEASSKKARGKQFADARRQTPDARAETSCCSTSTARRMCLELSSNLYSVCPTARDRQSVSVEPVCLCFVCLCFVCLCFHPLRACCPLRPSHATLPLSPPSPGFLAVAVASAGSWDRQEGLGQTSRRPGWRCRMGGCLSPSAARPAPWHAPPSRSQEVTSPLHVRYVSVCPCPVWQAVKRCLMLAECDPGCPVLH